MSGSIADHGASPRSPHGGTPGAATLVSVAPVADGQRPRPPLAFDRVYRPEDPSDDVLRDCDLVVRSALDGYSGCIVSAAPRLCVGCCPPPAPCIYEHTCVVRVVLTRVVCACDSVSGASLSYSAGAAATLRRRVLATLFSATAAASAAYECVR